VAHFEHEPFALHSLSQKLNRDDAQDDYHDRLDNVQGIHKPVGIQNHHGGDGDDRNQRHRPVIAQIQIQLLSLRVAFIFFLREPASSNR
jgi:hypothetical protein